MRRPRPHPTALLALLLGGLAGGPACRPDFQSARAPGRPAAEVARSLVRPSDYRGPSTEVKVGLGEASTWEVSCPDRLHVLFEDDPSDRVLVRRGLAVRVSAANAAPSEPGVCAAMEITEDVASIRDQVLAFGRDLGFEPRIEVRGARFASPGTPDAAIDRRSAHLVLEPCGSRERAEEVCERIRAEHGFACETLAGVARPAAGPITLTTARGTEVGSHHGPVAVRCAGFDTVYLRKDDEEAGTFRGTLLFAPQEGDRSVAVNRLDLESYVKGVVPAEIYPTAPGAALQAQAIAARTALISWLGVRHRTEPFDVCSTSSCQVYRGVGPASAATDGAVDETAGLVLARAEDLVPVAYHAVSGGRTEANEVAWPGSDPSPALRPVVDGPPGDEPTDLGDEEALWAFLVDPPGSYSAWADRHRWTRAFLPGELGALVSKDSDGPPIGAVRSLEPGDRGFSGRATTLVVRGEEGRREIRGELAIRRALGDLPSSAFAVRTISGEDGVARVFVLVGAGHGHGVGMSQVGAMGMAEQGLRSAEILGHYFGGAEVVQLLP